MKIRLPILIAVGFGLLLIAFYAAGANPWTSLQTIVRGSLGNASTISGTLREAVPLMIAGIAVFLALRAGLFNIGVEGQLTIGALAAAATGLAAPGPFGALLAVVAGMAGGAVWAFPAGWIRAYRGGHEVITTIMLNSVAALFSTALVAGPLKAAGQENPTTASLAAHTRLSPLELTLGAEGRTLSISPSLVIGLMGCLALAVWLSRRVAGYELRAVGANPVAAEFAGIQPKRVMLWTMVVSGAVGGLGGALQVLAFEGRFYQGLSSGYGFEALGVALLAGSSALAIIPAALLFAILSKGGNSLAVFEGVPKGITTVVLAILIVLAAATRYRPQRREID